jgi:cytochrome d ubiquinol oxidase subunit I
MRSFMGVLYHLRYSRRARMQTDLAFARGQMALSLGFHIVFAAAGVALPLLMVIAEWRHHRTGDRVFLELARRWAKGTAILFAVGAVSGTVLSFELGLLWPSFMAFAGAIIGMPFSLEGFAFFTEAIFLGIYLYGWERVSPRLHLLSGVAVAVSGCFSAFFVILANTWMNAPSGFRLAGGQPVDVDPVRAMFSPGWAVEVGHMLIASYLATAAAMAAVHAAFLLRDPGNRFHRAAYAIAMAVVIPTALAQPISGDASARAVALRQPAKLAALEGQFASERGAPLRIGGWPDAAARRTRYALEIPRGLSLLAYHDPDAKVAGLEAFPQRDWPPTRIVHTSFQIMVGAGSALALVAAGWGLVLARRRRLPVGRAALLAVIAAGPLGFVAIEAGWAVTEVGRQPWVVYGVVRTSEAVTSVSGLGAPFALVTALYLLLGAVVAVLLYRLFAKTKALDVGAA